MESVNPFRSATSYGNRQNNFVVGGASCIELIAQGH